MSRPFRALCSALPASVNLAADSSSISLVSLSTYFPNLPVSEKGRHMILENSEYGLYTRAFFANVGAAIQVQHHPVKYGNASVIINPLISGSNKPDIAVRFVRTLRIFIFVAKTSSTIWSNQARCCARTHRMQSSRFRVRSSSGLYGNYITYIPNYTFTYTTSIT